MDGDDDVETNDQVVVGPLGSLLPVLSPSSLFKDSESIDGIKTDHSGAGSKSIVVGASSASVVVDGKGASTPQLLNANEQVRDDEDEDDEEEDDDDEESDEEDGAEANEDEPPGKRGPKRSVQNIPYTVTRNGFQRLFKCDSCDRSFSRKGSLFRHHREKHAATTPAFNCQYCNYVSCKKTNLGKFGVVFL